MIKKEISSKGFLISAAFHRQTHGPRTLRNSFLFENPKLLGFGQIQGSLYRTTAPIQPFNLQPLF